MKQSEKDLESGASVVRLDGVLPRRVSSPEPLPKEMQQLVMQLRELERKIESLGDEREDLRADFQALESAVRSLSLHYSQRQIEIEQSLTLIAQSVREQFLEFHQFKGEVLGLAAHVNRWTKRLEDLARMTPISWARKLKRK